MDRSKAAFAAAEVIASANGGRLEPMTLRLDLGNDLRIIVRVVRVEARPTECELDILRILRLRCPLPTTTTALLADLDRRGMIHGESTVKHTLARMSRAGTILASSRAPRGYRLPSVAPRDLAEGA